jgi:hypothetical protein
MNPISIALALAALLSVGFIVRWTTRRNTSQVRLDRGLRGYLTAGQR